MKIGLVLAKSPSYSETFFISKINGLKKAGLDVILFVQDNPDNFNLCKVICAPKISKNSFLKFLKSALVLISLFPYTKRLLKFYRLERQIRKSKAQILKNIINNSHILKSNLDWLHFGFATIALQSENVAKTINAKMAISLRGYDIDVYPLKHDKCYDFLWKNVDKIHAISNYTYKRALHFGLDKNIDYQIINPAVDFSNLPEIKPSNSKVLKIITISRLHWIKGLNYTLEALALLKKKGVNFEYTIIGNGNCFEEIKFTIHQLDLNNEIKLLGKKTHQEVMDYLQKSDIYLQYSISEGFCNAVLEAQAIGLLCVVSDAEGLKENLGDKNTNFIVPKRNSVGLANTLQEVIELSKNEKNDISFNARKRIEKNFNIKKQQQEFINFYTQK